MAALLLVALSLSAVPARAASHGAGKGGPLSPLLSSLAKPGVRGKSQARQAKILGVPARGPGSLLRAGDRVVVSVHFDHGAIASRDELHAAGGQVMSASRSTQSATVAVPPADLGEIAALPSVASIAPERTPMLYAVNCEGGSVVSEGVQQLEVGQARSAFGPRGKGITVGVLSDSFDEASAAATHAHEDVLSADLPGRAGSCSDQQEAVDVLQDEPEEATDEGRGMAQIVHDLAPHASLAFATAFEGEESFAHNIERLAKPVSSGGAGAQVIVDDVGWFREPFFQDGPVAAAVNKVTKVGVTYLSAAGNDNLFDSKGNEIASWEAPEFRDAGSCPTLVSAVEASCMNFKASGGVDNTFGITVQPRETLLVDLQWAEPWYGVEADLDAYLLNGKGTNLLAVSEEDNVDQTPFELIGWENPSQTEAREVQLVIKRCSTLACNPKASLSAKPRLKFAMLENGRGVSATEYPENEGEDVVGPTVFGHAGAASAITVGAVPYNNSNVVEKYSSRGPVTHYFGPVVGTSPAAALAAPEVIQKPDLVATDCGRTTFFASQTAPGVWRFCGTSAAAPHAAAVAALLKQAEPLASPEEIREKLTSTTKTVGSFPPDARGAGLIDAYDALASFPQPLEIDDPASTEVAPLEGGETKYETEPEPEPKHEEEKKQEEPKQEEKPPTPQPTPTPQPPLETGSAPATLLLTHPKKIVRTRRASARVVFRFGSEPAGASFRCRFDGSAWRGCAATVARRFGLGPHVVRAEATSGGLLDSSPVVYRFRVARSR